MPGGGDRGGDRGQTHPGASRAGGGALATSQLHAHPPACPGFSTNTEWGPQPKSRPRSSAPHYTQPAHRPSDTGQSSGRAPSSGDFQSKLKPQGCECRRRPRSRPGGESPVPRGQGLPFLPLPIPALPDLSPPLLRCLSVAPDTHLYRSAVYTLSCCSRRRLGHRLVSGTTCRADRALIPPQVDSVPGPSQPLWLPSPTLLPAEAVLPPGPAQLF